MSSASPRALEHGANQSAFASGRNLLLATLALALLAGLLRLAVMEELFPTRLLGDEFYYAEVAASLGRGEGHLFAEQSGTTTRAFRPNAQAFLLSLVLRGVESPVAADQPGWIFKKLARNTMLLFAPDATLFYKIRGGSYGQLPRSVLASLLLVNTLLYTLIVIGAVLGVAQARESGRCALACMIFTAVIALHALVNSVARFRMPWMPVLMVYASYFALHWRSARWRPLTARAWG